MANFFRGIRRGKFQSKHNYNKAKIMVFIAEQNKN
jgi:hypothetical protein